MSKFSISFVIFLFFHSSIAAANTNVQGKITILDAKGNIKNDQSGVVVFLDEWEETPLTFHHPQREAMKQVNKQFVPQVLPIVVGTIVDFPNDDLIFHNVFSYSKTKSFDLGIYKQGKAKSITFDQTGLVKVYCNIHSHMIGYILILSNPFFTVTDVNGNFAIPEVPMGKATLRTWSARSLSFPERKIQITPEGILGEDGAPIEKLEFQIKEDVISIEHKNKWGKDYPSKY